MKRTGLEEQLVGTGEDFKSRPLMAQHDPLHVQQYRHSAAIPLAHHRIPLRVCELVAPRIGRHNVEETPRHGEVVNRLVDARLLAVRMVHDGVLEETLDRRRRPRHRRRCQQRNVGVEKRTSLQDVVDASAVDLGRELTQVGEVAGLVVPYPLRCVPRSRWPTVVNT